MSANPQSAEKEVLSALPTVEKLADSSGLSPKWKHVVLVALGAAGVALTYLSGYPTLTIPELAALVPIEAAFLLSDKE
jgi:hypothetical protein